MEVISGPPSKIRIQSRSSAQNNLVFYKEMVVYIIIRLDYFTKTT